MILLFSSVYSNGAYVGSVATIYFALPVESDDDDPPDPSEQAVKTIAVAAQSPRDINFSH